MIRIGLKSGELISFDSDPPNAIIEYWLQGGGGVVDIWVKGYPRDLQRPEWINIVDPEGSLAEFKTQFRLEPGK
jgi:hypothetical protein